MTDITQPPFKNILITGAGGALGSVLRDSLRPYAETLSLNARQSLGEVRENEKHFICDLADRDAVFGMLKGVDVVVHMGGAPRENTFQVILDSNIVGSYNIYEGARQAGVKRVIYASSVHAIGFYECTQTIDANVPQRPDSLYGVSKTFVENLSRYYYDKFGIESVCLRIGSCFPKPIDRRMLATWLSYDDFSHLCVQSLMTPSVGHMIVYGNSNNSANFWDNTQAAYLGYRPKDTADIYRAEVYAKTGVPDPRHPAVRFQGGQFAADGHFEDPKVD
ncbi:NAD(P)-dependent oxidoreductase [Burkholderia multivorans]|uniref:NAD-dependent epimerase/dehydratase family protein n=1 Tax=Burkholderia multivorans TaxID=87883 RepID=UPI001C24A030|nr:NAD(P)-dependent oxidoreductase [Burkholderia multivorans]MBU9133461.1 NAD(P)-dependent oxidoreductase [Burkholderia multivorans]MDN7651805.1 NAD(P)-dependent oxidoreductase [Burkholderia multivorans]